ncbi:MAG: hypothetical protein ACR2GU_03710 [Rubrobacteraceae bacterium]
MRKYIGHINEATWPEARAILDAFRVGYRTSPNRHAKHMEGYDVWVEVESFAGEPWWEELVEAKRDHRIVWQPASEDCQQPIL